MRGKQMLLAKIFLLLFGKDALWLLLIWVLIIIPGLIAGAIYLLYKFAKRIRTHIDSKNKDETPN